jgi:sulfoquinovose isomerase
LSNRKWIALASHPRLVFEGTRNAFFVFERRIINPLGGFYDLDDEGRPAAPGYGAADKEISRTFRAKLGVS